MTYETETWTMGKLKQRQQGTMGKENLQKNPWWKKVGERWKRRTKEELKTLYERQK